MENVDREINRSKHTIQREDCENSDSDSQEQFYIRIRSGRGTVSEMENMSGREAVGLDTNTLPTDIDNTAGSSRPPPKKPLKRAASYYTPYMEDRLRRKLKFHFMGPHEKFKAKRKCPWKLLLQIFKVVLVTIQLVIFGKERSSFVEYVEKNNIAMKHMYLLKWDPSFETMPYPPATGLYALYTTDDVISHINYAMESFDMTENTTLGSLRFAHHNGTRRPLRMCIKSYKEGSVFKNDSYSFDSGIVIDCMDLRPIEFYNKTVNQTQYKYDVEALMKSENKTFTFDRTLLISLRLELRSIRLALERRSHEPECFRITGKIEFDDSNKDGQMLVNLFSSLAEFDCVGKFSSESDEAEEKMLQMMYDVFVIIISTLSCLLCLRSLYRSQKLRKETVDFFQTRHRKKLNFSDQFEFVNLWYIVIVINDILTITGSAFKIQLEHRNARSSSENYDLCAVMLGTGTLLVWMGVIRYIGFFKTFNILTVVLKKAFPDMMRFLVTTFMLYFGFMLCGWVVLGPYHVKFRFLSTASECLFSLVNGDDMFVTFSATVTDDNLVWYYSRVYLYIFVSLFIYAVLNLFIAVILDTYETIKEYYEKGFPKSELFEFIGECDDTPDSHLYKGEDRTCSCGILCLLCCFCCKRPKTDNPSEYTSLLH